MASSSSQLKRKEKKKKSYVGAPDILDKSQRQLAYQVGRPSSFHPFVLLLT